jgi:glycine hydroxymethyltransferase
MKAYDEVVGFEIEDDLSSVDPDLDRLIKLEEERQDARLILIPSESICPWPVRQALASVFTSIYAEGYPPPRMGRDSMKRLLDVDLQKAYIRRYADRRHYKGCENVDLVEALAQKRVAQLFARDDELTVKPEEILVNVQALSGAAANNAVYEALLQPGDTFMGMDLTNGGHLTHGSQYNRSGKYFNVVSYCVDPRTGKLNYDEIERQARECQPKIIVGGASAFPWDIDWKRLRQIADAVPGRARLLADISHPAGLVVAGLFPNPVGYADVVTFTTHKTLCGPRAAVILTMDQDLSAEIDRAVFPGEQGGPHVNNIAAMAVTFKLAATEEFKELQRATVANAQALAEALKARG